MNYSDMVEINVEVEALNLDGIKQNLLDYVQKEAKISIEESVEQAGKSAENAENAANIAEDAAISATESARQASESLGLYYTKVQSDTLLSSKQNTITGAATTITDNNLAASKVVVSDANGKVAVSDTTSAELWYVHGVTSAIQTQLNAKASTSLDNLSSAGQMIVDSANGTISNCILEIPQNIKASIASNVITLAGGSILTHTGSTYATYTTTADITRDISSDNLSDGKYIIFASHAIIHQPRLLSDVTSGSAFPTENLSNLSVFYNTTDKKIYRYLTNSSEWVNFTDYYPICLIEVNSGVVSFAKDANGNDIIFNGWCYIGGSNGTQVSMIVFPGIKYFLPNGLNTNGRLNNLEYTTRAVIITSRTSGITNANICLEQNGLSVLLNYNYREVDELPATASSGMVCYNRKTNLFYRYITDHWQNTLEIVFLYFTKNATGIADIQVRQPYEGARYLLTDEIKEEVATKQADVTTLTGYDATKTQTLKNVSGVLTWVDDE